MEMLKKPICASMLSKVRIYNIPGVATELGNALALLAHSEALFRCRLRWECLILLPV